MKNKTYLKHIVLISLLFGISILNYGQDNPIFFKPGSSAALELNSTSKGFLVPRLTTPQINLISIPATGLLLYNTDDNCFWVKETATWKRICNTDNIYDSLTAFNQQINILQLTDNNLRDSINIIIDTIVNINSRLATITETLEKKWDINGNYGTDPNINFIGTLDNKDFSFRTNNIENLKLFTNGNVDIGINNPSSLVSVQNLKILNGYGNNYIFSSDATGLGSWKQLNFSLSSGILSLTNHNVQIDLSTLYSAGTGININGTTIENTLPDQTVTITSGTGISTSGTYPNFTINNSQPDQTISLSGTGSTSVSGMYPNFTINSSDNNTIYTAGTGIDVSGTIITNTTPDQTVTLTGGSGINISGAYPDFTITNDQPNATHTGDAIGSTSLTVIGLQGRSISTVSPTTGQVLKWNGTKWSPASDNNTSFTAGTGLSFTGNTINSVWTKSGNNIYNNNTQNVGIGIQNPQSNLHIHGGASGGSSNAKSTNPPPPPPSIAMSTLQLTNPSTGITNKDGLIIGTLLNTAFIKQCENASLDFYTFNLKRVTILGNGNVGIGTTTNPTAKLDINGNVHIAILPVQTTSLNIITEDGIGNLGKRSIASINDNLGNHTATMNLKIGDKYISATGDDKGIKINDNNKISLLEDGINGIQILRNNGIPNRRGFSIDEDAGGIPNGNFNFWIHAWQNSAFNFKLNTEPGSTTLMTINKNGNVGIGTTTLSAKLHINAGNNTGFQLDLNHSGDWGHGILINANLDNNKAIAIYKLGSENFTVLGSGNTYTKDLNVNGTLHVSNLPDYVQTTSVIVEDGSGNIGKRNLLTMGDNFGNHIASTNVNMNDNTIYLHWNGDTYHGLKYSNSFAGQSMDGPALFGYSNGVLGTKTDWGGENIALFWNYLGNVGIGTTSPATKLEVSGSIKIPIANNIDNNSPGLLLVTNDDFTYNGQYLNHYGFGFHKPMQGCCSGAYISGFSGVDIFTGGQNRLTVLENGNVGIGTNAPEKLLHVYTNNNMTNEYDAGIAVGNTTTDKTYLYMGANQANNYVILAGVKSHISNNTKLLLNPNGGNVGIGTTQPDQNSILHVVDNKSESIVHFQNSGGGSSIMSLKIGEGTPEGQWGEVSHYGVDNSLRIRNINGNGSTRGNLLLNWDGGNVGIGTTCPQNKLDVKGIIRGTEIISEPTFGCDFVFDNNYKLLTLEEIENFIKINKHLPEIPSAQEMITDGLKLTEMNLKLLQKIEELTLYLLQQNKRIEKLEQNLIK